MAQQTQVLLIDDIDGEEAHESISFGIDGSEYLIDLSNGHAREFRDVLEKFVAHARKVSRAPAQRTARWGHQAPLRSERHDREESRAIRDWAASTGRRVEQRGRIPEPLRTEWEQAGKPQAAAQQEQGGTGTLPLDEPAESPAPSPAPRGRRTVKQVPEFSG